MPIIESRDFPSSSELNQRVAGLVESTLSVLPHPLTEAAVDVALKGKVDRWNWRLTWGTNEVDVEEAEIAVREGKPVDVLIYAFGKGGGSNVYTGAYRANMIVPDRRNKKA